MTQRWKFGGVLLAAVLLVACEGNPVGPSGPVDGDNDGSDNNNTQTVTIIIECPGCSTPTIPVDTDPDNRPPVLALLTSQTNQQGVFVSGVQIRADDPDGDTLTFIAGGLPRGLSINGATGIISGTISSSSAADSPFNAFVSVSDGRLSDSGNFVWTVTP